MSRLSDCRAENERLRAKIVALRAERDKALADLAECEANLSRGTYPSPTTHPSKRTYPSKGSE